MEQLECLILAYAENKKELDSYKELCERENKEIKKIMLDNSLTSFEAGDYTAKIATQNRTTLDEEKLLYVMKQGGYNNVIKTKEYVDMDALESALYHNDIDKQTMEQMDKCQNIKEVITLTVKKRGK